MQSQSNTTNSVPQTHQTVTDNKLLNLKSDNFEKSKHLLEVLSRKHRYAEAIKLLSNSLSSENNVLWAFNCLKILGHEHDNAPELVAAEQWLNEKNETNRANILPDRTIPQPDASTWLAMATYWSGDSTDTDNTSADNNLINQSIYSCIMLSIKDIEKSKQTSAYDSVISEGLKMLNS